MSQVSFNASNLDYIHGHTVQDCSSIKKMILYYEVFREVNENLVTGEVMFAGRSSIFY